VSGSLDAAPGLGMAYARTNRLGTTIMTQAPRPLIGITCGLDGKDAKARTDYADALCRAGGEANGIAIFRALIRCGPRSAGTVEA